MKKALIFIITAGVSGYIGYKIGYSQSRKKYSDLADIEVESVKARLTEHYEKKLGEVEPVSKNNEKNKNANLKDTMFGDANKEQNNKKTVKKKDYGSQYRTETKVDRIVGTPEVKPEFDPSKPYIIRPEEFNESNNEIKTLFYYADKVLTDDDYNIISNIGIVGGYSILDQIGLYEEACLHVRDERIAVDYEIHLDERKYKNIKPINIHDSEED